ncbi:hypothetical protein CC85DRAFT_285380 [Cutaneotrichosporon oleaginosum]|uniref:Uncharacterized protein n=1 Tax=Cutaneotrichosporon oleaginosum TaxID=879819 RepID=A0A0J0XNK1_9TREE|nr:uncharacterized protein CC85DRAFT_285380 [Cutaneotrichosporon oleaginosum]KLT42658.1 hypothetical protein CC85DRAFT_285380 [Cutaneotrichosporon oleaginosum]TXT05225.1 hypothetical protein COLE_06545 [Cutaneotrichosporon oleaginosum]
MSTLSRSGAAALARASFASTSRAASARRTIVSIPAPELTNSAGTTEFAVRTFERMPNMTYAFAIVRAIEAKYGVVLNIDVVKDADSLRPANRLFVTLLKPVELPDGDNRFEIPAPKYNAADTTGGVSLADIEAALRPAPPVEAAEGETQRTIKFSLEPRTRKARDFRYLRYANRVSAREQREDDEIVRALQAFSGGFYNGLAGVADKFKGLVLETTPDLKERRAAQEAEETLRAEIAAQEAEIARELAAQKAARAAAANAAAAQAVQAESEEGESDVAQEEVVDDKTSRLEMLKNRALEAARRKVAADAEARQAAVASKAASAAAKVQAARAEPALAAQERKAEPATKSTWRWFEKK